MARMALGGEGTQRNGGSRDGEGTLGASGGMGELKKTMLCETVAWLGVIKPKGASKTDILFARCTCVYERIS